MGTNGAARATPSHATHLAWRALLLAAALAACGGGERSRSPEREAAGAAGAAARYEAVPVPHGARLSGVVTARNASSVASTIVPPPALVGICGAAVRTAPFYRSRDGTVAGAIVWLEGVRRGKPLPLRRRFELASERCLYTPRVQAAVVGGTLNVLSGDAVVNRTRFTAASTGSVLAVVRQSDAGQLVPESRPLARAGLVRVTSDALPWMRAWIRVFAHPYFSLTGPDGRFVLDSVPPGTYTLVTWQERLGELRRRVTVRGGEQVRVSVTYGAARPVRVRAAPSAE